MNVGIVAEKSQQTQKKEKWKLFGLFSCKKLLLYVANGKKFLSADVSSLNTINIVTQLYSICVPKGGW
jgi:hypothetical protein